jgi:hypothetical protein
VRWEPVPADLSVSIPRLEDALLGLLSDDAEQPGDGQAPSYREDLELAGGRR